MTLYLLTNTEPENLGPLRLVAVEKLSGNQYLSEHVFGGQQVVATPRHADQRIEDTVATGGVVYISTTRRVLKPGDDVHGIDLQTLGFGILSKVPAVRA